MRLMSGSSLALDNGRLRLHRRLRHFGLLCRRRLCLHLLRLECAWLAAFVLAAAPAAPMPLRLSLAYGRDRPQLRLRLRRFCRHEFTSWHCAVLCIVLLSESVFLPLCLPSLADDPALPLPQVPRPPVWLDRKSTR